MIAWIACCNLILTPSIESSLQNAKKEIHELTVDYTLQDALTPNPSLTLFPWGFYERVQFYSQRLIMTFLYPAQSSIQKWVRPAYSTPVLDKRRVRTFKKLHAQGYSFKELVLEKNKVRYSGLLIYRESSKNNGQWIIQATGNCMPYEPAAPIFANHYNPPDCPDEHRFNLLFVNGPGVGKSDGIATPASMGDAQEIGISYLEELGAKKIVLAGFSLGGAAMGQAILKHEFKKDRQYLVVSQMTFDRASNICSKIYHIKNRILKSLMKGFIHWSGCEMDTVKASQKTQNLFIPEVIIQAGKEQEGSLIHDSDSLIPKKASLGYRVKKEKINQLKTHALIQAKHNDLDRFIERTRIEILKWSQLHPEN